MKKLAAISGATLALCLYGAPANAQAVRTWVANNGNDGNSCSSTSPCKTFAGALSKTFINGEINCLDAGAYGAVTIAKSITIDCRDNFAGSLAAFLTGVTINIPVSADDPLRTVRLRNLNLNGAGSSGTVGTRTGINGIRIDAALAVFVEDVHVSSFTQKGLLDQRTAAGKLYVRNSTFRDNGQSGMVILPSSGSAVIDVLVDNSQFIGNVIAGIAASNGPRIAVKRSVISGNGTGLDAEGVAAASQLVVDDSVVSGNGQGLFQSGTGVLRISNSDINFNGVLGGGTTQSFTNNRFTGNGAGGTLTVIAPAGTNPSGQQ